MGLEEADPGILHWCDPVLRVWLPSLQHPGGGGWRACTRTESAPGRWVIEVRSHVQPTWGGKLCLKSDGSDTMASRLRGQGSRAAVRAA